MSTKVHVPKDARELDVFRAFVAAGHLPVNSETISHRPEPEPDVLCSLAGGDHYFELSEVFWESPNKPGYTVAKGLHESVKASKLIAQGKTDNASMGQFGYPPLLSFKQSLERKLTRHYTLHNERPCSLLLYY